MTARFRLGTAAACLAFAGFARAAETTFEDHVLPVLRTHCGNCHNQDRKEGDLNLVSYAALMAGGSSGAAVEAGGGEASRLYRLMAHLDEPKMPPRGAKVPAKELAVVKTWIDGGLLERKGGQAKASKRPKVDLALAAGASAKPTGPAAMPNADFLADPVVKTKRAQMAFALATSPWAPLLAVAAQRQVLLYHTATQELVGVLPFPEGMPYTVKFSRNGALLLAGGGIAGKSGKVVVWKVDTGERVAEVGDEADAVLAADISADQSLIALGGSSKLVKLYAIKDGELVATMKKHTDWVMSCDFSPDGVLLATGDRNGGAVVWEGSTGKEFYVLPGHTGSINGLAWRSDSNLLATASEDTTVKLWEMQNGGAVKSWGAHGGGVLSMAVAPDNTLVTVGRDNVAKAWTFDGNLKKQFPGMPDVPVRAAAHFDNQRAIAADWTGAIRMWNLADAKPIAELTSNPPTLAEQLATAAPRLEALRKETPALATANTAAQAAFAAARDAHTKANAAQGAAKAAEAAALAKANEAKGKHDRLAGEADNLRKAYAAKQKQMTDAAAAAAAVKNAMGAAGAAEKTAEGVAKAQAAAVADAAEMVKKLEAAQASADPMLKSALEQTRAELAVAAAAKGAADKVLAVAGQRAKALADAAVRHEQAAQRCGGELAALQKELDLKAKALPALAADAKAQADAHAKTVPVRQAADAAVATALPALKPAEAAAQAAAAKAGAAQAELAALTVRETTLRRRVVVAKQHHAKAELDAKERRFRTAEDTAKAVKLAFEKATLESADLPKQLPLLEAAAVEAAKKLAAAQPKAPALQAEIARHAATLADTAPLAAPAAELAGKLKAVLAKSPADAAAKASFDQAQATASSLAARVAEAAALKPKKEQELAAAHAEIAALQAAATAAAEKLAAAKTRLPKLPAELARLKAKLPAEEQELAAAKQAYDASNASLASIAQELAKLGK